MSAPVVFDAPPTAPVEYRPPADRILGGDPAQRAWNLHASADGRFNAGIWDVREPARKYYAIYE